MWNMLLKRARKNAYLKISIAILWFCFIIWNTQISILTQSSALTLFLLEQLLEILLFSRFIRHWTHQLCLYALYQITVKNCLFCIYQVLFVGLYNILVCCEALHELRLDFVLYFFGLKYKYINYLLINLYCLLSQSNLQTKFCIILHGVIPLLHVDLRIQKSFIIFFSETYSFYILIDSLG